MGFFFSDSKPHVGKDEWRKVRNDLSACGFEHKRIDRVEEIFRGDLYELQNSQKGIDTNEIDAAIAWMRAHMSEHPFSKEKIATIERVLRKYL
ncbi:MAG: hypothetical protein WCW14_00095 [Candidatus Paceibacterota bacterium]|jgi:hypothetical protein